MAESPAAGTRLAPGLGIALVLLANLLFAFVDTSTKWLLGAGLLVVQLAFMRYAVHFAITFVQRLASGKSIGGLSRHVFGLVVLRSFCLVSATLVNFFALGHLPLSVTSAILHLSPVLICLFAAPLLGETITRHNWLAIALGLTGALVIIWPGPEGVNWYAVLMIYPAAGFALYQVLTRMLAGQVTAGALQFHTGAMGTIALAPLAALGWSTPDSPQAWLLMIALGTFAWAGHEALTRAYGLAQASALAPFGYSFVVYLTLAGAVFFSEVPTLNQFVGTVLVVAAGLYAWIKIRG